ncbi:MAG: DUF2339 domain-containing protein, partial [Planctomycetota bacterium]
YLTVWMWLVLVTGAAWMTCGWLSSGWMVRSERGGFAMPGSRRACITIACVLLPIGFLHEENAWWALACSWFVLAAGAFTVSRWIGRPLSTVPSIAYLLISTLVVLLIPLVGDPAYANPAMIGGFAASCWLVLVVVISGSWFVCGWNCSGPRDHAAAGPCGSDQTPGWLAVLRMPSLVMGSVLLPAAFVHGESETWTIACAWFGLCTAAFAVRATVRQPLVSLAVFGYLVITTVLVLSLPFTDDPSSRGVQVVGGLVLSWWMLLTGVIGISWLLCGWRCFGQRETDVAELAWVGDMRSLCLVIGCVVLPLVFLHADATREGVMAGWFGLTLVSFGISRLVRHRYVSVPSAVYLGLVTLLWLASFLIPGWMGRRDTAPLFLHPGLIWAVVITGSWCVYARAVRRSEHRVIRESGIGAWWIAGVLLLISTTFEVARFAGAVTDDPTAREGSVSVWWAIVAVGLLGGGFARAIAPLRYAGIGLLLIATGKVLTYDLAELSPAVRVGSFIGCGLVLLGVAAWYLRSGAKKQENGVEEHVLPADEPESEFEG